MDNYNMIKAAEEERLRFTLEVIEQELRNYDNDLRNLPNTTDNKYLLADLSRLYLEKMKELESIKDKPYFARIDFKEEKQEDAKKVYIGKANSVKNKKLKKNMINNSSD